MFMINQYGHKFMFKYFILHGLFHIQDDKNIEPS